MKGREINKSHPLYEEYVEKYKKIYLKYADLIDAEEAKYPDWNGLDHPASDKTFPLDKERSAKLKDLQKEYDFLFTTKES